MPWRTKRREYIDRLEELSRLANAGDSAAATEFLAANSTYWIAATRKLVYACHQRMAEDLVQDAVLKLLELWEGGRGPARNVRAYVMVTVRHAYIDLLRSPRSRVGSLDEAEEPGLELAVAPAEIDDLYEREQVRRTLTKLCDDHRAVLEAVLMDGLKPASLVVQLGRSAPAISNLLSRAKRAFREEWSRNTYAELR
ncbi:RNA polymerase sigma factor [Leucobacter sp. HY1908]